MPKEKEVEVVVIPPEHLRDEDFVIPRANWMFIDACGNTVLLKHPDKAKCDQWVTDNYGAGKYKLRAMKEKKPKGEISCRGFSNSKSMSGQKLVQIRNSQGRGI